MLDIRKIRENPDLFQEAARNKMINCSISALLELDQKRKGLREEIDSLRHELKSGNKKIRELQGEDREAHLANMKELSSRSKALEQEFREVEENFQAEMLRVPSPMHPSVPIGKDDSENVEVTLNGEIPAFDFPLKSHTELGKDLDLMDIERGVKLSGSRFYFLKNEGTLLELAILRYALDFLTQRGFGLMTVPVLVKEHAMMGTGYFPGGEEQAYKMANDDLFLVGTSEVSLASYHYDEILDPGAFPVKYAAWSNCFRREAGTYGKDTQGLYRIHQFQKVEQVYLLENDEEKSHQALEELLQNAVDFLNSLEIPHQVVTVCSGDLGQGQVKKYDINSWMPSRDSYCETHSCSMFYEFQARRLKMRYRQEDGSTAFCHTLNNTLIASPRILIPLLELNQKPDGSIRIPRVLQPYMNGLEEIRPKE